MNEINCVGILAHPLRSESFPIARRISDDLKVRGLTTWVHTEWAEADVIHDVNRADMVIAIGGDGAMLRASRVCARAGVPILGVNMGQLGFLTEIADPDTVEEKLELVFADQYWIEARSMLTATAFRNGQRTGSADALNDIVIAASVVGHMVELEVYIDQDWATTYHADAVVVASATGSTAYALACGGPILPPELRNILIVPAAPHLSMSRPIVLSEGAQVDILVTERNRTSIVFLADGTKIVSLREADVVRVQVSDLVSRFIRLRGRNYFYRSILDRLEPRIQRDRPHTELVIDENGITKK